MIPGIKNPLSKLKEGLDKVKSGEIDPASIPKQPPATSQPGRFNTPTNPYSAPASSTPAPGTSQPGRYNTPTNPSPAPEAAPPLPGGAQPGRFNDPIMNPQGSLPSGEEINRAAPKPTPAPTQAPTPEPAPGSGYEQLFTDGMRGMMNAANEPAPQASVGELGQAPQTSYVDYGDAAQAEHLLTDRSSDAAARQRLDDLFVHLNDRVQGLSPSVAELQFGRQRDEALAANLAMARSGVGNAGLAMRGAAQNAANTIQKSAADAAILRAQEQRDAEKLYGDTLDAYRKIERDYNVTDATTGNAVRTENARLANEMGIAQGDSRTQVGIANTGVAADFMRDKFREESQTSRFNAEQQGRTLDRKVDAYGNVIEGATSLRGQDIEVWKAKLADAAQRYGYDMQTLSSLMQMSLTTGVAFEKILEDYRLQERDIMAARQNEIGGLFTDLASGMGGVGGSGGTPAA